MLGRNIGLAAASALGASAFLIPTGIAPSDTKAATFAAFSIVNPKNQVLRVPCSACLFPYNKDESVKEEAEGTEDGWFHIQSASNDVILNFTVSDAQTLELNGATVYTAKNDFRAPTIFVDQVPSSASNVEIENGAAARVSLEMTGLAVGVSSDDSSPSGDGVISLSVSPLQLESLNVKFDEVTVELLRTVEGELLILNVEHVPSRFNDLDLFKPAPGGEVEEVEEQPCGPFCRIKGAIESKIHDLKSFAHSKSSGKKPGCGGRRRPVPGGKLPSHIKPGFLHPEVQHHAEQEDKPLPPFFNGRPHHFGHPHGHHGHHRHHGFFHHFVRGALAVAVPILAGVAVGMFISVASLLIGRFVGFLWTTFVRGGRRGYESVSLDDDECVLGVADISDEKVVYVAEADLEAPPVYENAPAYEEAPKSEQ